MTVGNALPWEHRGAVHSNLDGSHSSLRFRPRRLSVTDLTFDVACDFEVETRSYGPAKVLDLSPTGIAVDPAGCDPLPPGSQVSSLRLLHRKKIIWQGEAQAVYQVNGPSARIGLRFTSGLFDLQLLRLNDSFVGNRLGSILEQNTRFIRALPDSWRARVATARRLLVEARDFLEETEARLSESPEARIREENELFKEVFASWGPHYLEVLAELHSASKGFNAQTSALARAYATRELLPLVYSCPMHSRAYEKPLGYAGDYRMMLLMLGNSYEGDTLYARFLHHVSKSYSFGRAVPAREITLRDKVSSFLAAKEPVRVVSVACGPAVELQRILRDNERFNAPVELILVDQDEQTLQYCHESLSREILSGPGNSSSHVGLNCLHVSVKQLLKPRDEKERQFISSNLENADLIYSVGLFDYLPDAVARLLVRRLYSLLRPGGELFLGNLKECPDTSWMMEHTLAWHLEYRTPETLLQLAKALDPAPASQEVVADETGYCLFLNISRPRQ